jgi:hypothetical protein
MESELDEMRAFPLVETIESTEVYLLNAPTKRLLTLGETRAAWGKRSRAGWETIDCTLFMTSDISSCFNISSQFLKVNINSKKFSLLPFFGHNFSKKLNSSSIPGLKQGGMGRPSPACDYLVDLCGTL